VSLSSLPAAGQASGTSSALKGGDTSRGGASQAWRDDFNGTALDTNRWAHGSGQAPGYRPGLHIGYYDPTSVRVANGVLVIDLTQGYGYVDGAWGVISRGGLISSRSTYGYGTYEWRMRMSSTATAPDGSGLPVSGSVSAGFNYVSNSKTEIDFEFAGHDVANIYMSNWHNTRPRLDPTENQLTSSTA
jgi:beta-glucanase (GH16 family)